MRQGIERLYFEMIVPINPLPKQSYRARNGRGGYIPKRLKDYEDKLRARAAEAMGPKATLPAGRMVKVEAVFGRRTMHKVDTDNLFKGLLDGLKGVVFEDDDQVRVLYGEKILGQRDQAFVYVRVYDLGEDGWWQTCMPMSNHVTRVLNRSKDIA